MKKKISPYLLFAALALATSVSYAQVPVANFSVSDSVFCDQGLVSFFDLSTGSPTSWLWSFPGASPSSSTLQNPDSIIYFAPGTYPVTLIATNSFGSDTL